MTTPAHTPAQKIQAYAAEFRKGLAGYIPDEVQRAEALAAIDDFERLAIEAAATALTERQVVALEKIAEGLDALTVGGDDCRKYLSVTLADIEQESINSLNAVDR